MKLTDEQNRALAEFIDAQHKTFATLLNNGVPASQFVRLAEIEQRMAAYRGEAISLEVAMHRAAAKHPEAYDAYRRSVTK